MIKGATLKIIEDGSHGMCSTNKEQINAELLSFIKG
jgi:non-heme chloroperoxidase